MWEPDNASWINNLGVLYALSGRSEDAAILFQSALELKPNEAVKRVAIRWVLLPLDSERIFTWDGTPASGEYQGVVPLHLVWPPGSTSRMMLDLDFSGLTAFDGATDEWTLFNAIEPTRTVLPPHPSDQVALIRKVSPGTSRQLQDYVQANVSNISVRKRR